MNSPKKLPHLQPDPPFAKRSTLAQCVATLMHADSPNAIVTSRASLETVPESHTSPAPPEPTDERALLESRFPILRLWR
jgi:hypothetical protein